MLKNNIELDVKTKCIEESKTQAWVAEEVGTSPRLCQQDSERQEKYRQQDIPLHDGGSGV